MRTSRTTVSLALATAMATTLAACKLQTPNKATTEGTVTTNANGSVALHLGGRTFQLRTSDGKPLANLTLQAAGGLYPSVDGSLHLPESVLSAAKTSADGKIRIFATGYVPHEFSIDQLGDAITLAPATPVVVVPAMPRDGGSLIAPDKSIQLDLGKGLLTADKTNVALSSYVPEPGEGDDAAISAQRTAFLKKVIPGEDPTKSCDDPFPCPPPKMGPGLLLTVDGPIQNGTVTATINLASADYASNPGVQQILQTFAAIDKRPDAQAIRDALYDQYGIKLDGQELTFRATVGDNQVLDGLVKVEVEGFELLGGKVELTVVSAARDNLPQAASVPALVALNRTDPATGLPTTAGGSAINTGAGATGIAAVDNDPNSVLACNDGSLIISHDAGSIISHDAGSIISHDAGSLISSDSGSIISHDAGSIISHDAGSIISHDAGSIISQDGGSIISHDAGSLINSDGGSLTGTVRVPFAPAGEAKFGLLSYSDYPWPGTRVYAYTRNNYPVYFPVDSQGNYKITNLPPSVATIFVVAEVGEKYRVVTVAPAPGHATVNANLDAGTTAVSFLDLDLRGVSRMPTMSFQAFDSDVRTMHANLSQNEARTAVSVTTNYKTVSRLARNNFGLLHLIIATVEDIVASLFPSPAPTGAGTPAPGPQAAAPQIPGVTYLTGSSGNPGFFQSNLAGTLMKGPTGLAFDATGGLLIADSGNAYVADAPLSGGNVTTAAGQPTAPGDGATQLNNPQGLVWSSDDNALYIADTGNNRVCKLAAGSLTVLAGSGTAAWLDAGGAAAAFNGPTDVAYQSNGHRLYVADAGNNTIREIQLSSGSVNTLFNLRTEGSHDGNSSQGTLKHPMNLAVDPSNNDIWVSDTGNNTIRRIDHGSHTISTFLGVAGLAGNQDGKAAQVRLSAPRGLSIDGVHNVMYVADSGNGVIRRVDLGNGDTRTLMDAYGKFISYANPTSVLYQPGAPAYLYVGVTGEHYIERVTLPTGW